jgi:hypothetical protein
MKNMNKIIYYYQTFTGLEDVLNQKPRVVTDIIISSIHFGLNIDGSPYIHINDNNPDDKTFNAMWSEAFIASDMGINVHLMLGGAGGAFVDLFENFEVYYKLLLDLINSKQFINGINLDVEESIGLDKIITLIERLDKDLDKDFQITLAPVSFALVTDTSGMGGFSYKDLKNSHVGDRISQLNGQFYGDFTFETYDNVIKNGYSEEEIVIGMLGSEYDQNSMKDACAEVKKIVAKYPNFAGVFVWEYCIAPPDKVNHALWAKMISNAIKQEKQRQKFVVFYNKLKEFFENLGLKIKELFKK